MKLNDLINKTPLWYPADGAGDPPATPPAGDPPATPPAGDPPATPPAGDPPATPPAGDPPATPPAGEAKLWWEGDGYKPAQEWMTKKGLLVEDQNDATTKAIEGWRNAEARLGKPAESMMDRPDKDQPLAEFMRANAETFGLPDKPEGYELPDLKLPEGMKFDEALMNGARQIAFDEGMPPAALEKMASLYAEHVGGLFGEDLQEEKKAKDEMHATLKKEWGDQTDAKKELAKSAFQVLADNVGMDADEQLVAARALSKNHGDAMVVKMFAGLADMIGEDSLVGLGKGGGFTTTPAEAKAKIAELKAKDGPYAKAIATKDKVKMAEYEAELARLNKIRAGE